MVKRCRQFARTIGPQKAAFAGDNVAKSQNAVQAKQILLRSAPFKHLLHLIVLADLDGI
ncbi:hypothetical protein PATSB16_09090 [Pandoraea thiooxydans]|nr:hypothetical protein PATSB16_09090 [Pandoraea thiooxydans]